MHIPFDPILGFSTAGFSTAALWLAQTADQVVPGVKGWIEVGGEQFIYWASTSGEQRPAGESVPNIFWA